MAFADEAAGVADTGAGRERHLFAIGLEALAERLGARVVGLEADGGEVVAMHEAGRRADDTAVPETKLVLPR